MPSLSRQCAEHPSHAQSHAVLAQRAVHEEGLQAPGSQREASPVQGLLTRRGHCAARRGLVQPHAVPAQQALYGCAGHGGGLQRVAGLAARDAVGRPHRCYQAAAQRRPGLLPRVPAEVRATPAPAPREMPIMCYHSAKIAWEAVWPCKRRMAPPSPHCVCVSTKRRRSMDDASSCLV